MVAKFFQLNQGTEHEMLTDIATEHLHTGRIFYVYTTKVPMNTQKSLSPIVSREEHVGYWSLNPDHYEFIMHN